MRVGLLKLGFGFRVVGSVVAIGAVMAAIGIAAATSGVKNGGFEAEDLSGWSVLDTSVTPTDTWYAYSGTRSPLTDNHMPKPKEGKFAATTDARNPGAHILYQDVYLEPGETHILSFILYYDNDSSGFHTPDNLDPTNDDPLNPNLNQQYRVDVLRGHVPADTMVPALILANVFRTEQGDDLRLKPTRMSYDLSGFAGSTVRLRFAEVDNQGLFLASVDDVRIADTVPGPGWSG